MLTLADRARLRAKNAEFHLSAGTIRMVAPIIGLRDPYLPQDDRLRTIFIHIPKTAGTSLRFALYGCKPFHIPAIRYKAFDEEKFNSYFKFCIVRNPWSRAVSAFYYLCERCNSSDMRFLDHRWAASTLQNVKDFQDFVFMLEDENYLNRVRE